MFFVFSSLFFILVFTFAGTQPCTLHAEAIAFASSSAFGLAAAFCQLLTRLSNGWKGCPENMPDFTTFVPTPVGRAFSLHFADGCLAPYAGSLEGRPLHMLKEGCTCLWNGIIRPLLPSKQVQSCLINVACSAVLVIHCDDKLLKDDEVCIFNYRRVLAEFFEDRADFRTTLPCLPCSFLAYPRKADTTSQPVKA